MGKFHPVYWSVLSQCILSLGYGLQVFITDHVDSDNTIRKNGIISEELPNPVVMMGYSGAVNWLVYPSCCIYVLVNLVSIGSSNALSPPLCQAITWTNADRLSIRPSGTNFSEILIKIQDLSFMEMHLKISSAKWWPFCPGGDELRCAFSQF